MKTFETEKHTIPEGATHYSNETEHVMFCWFKYVEVGEWKVMTAKESTWFDSENFEWKHYDLKPIPQTKEVEWVNGDACRYANDIEHEYIYIGEHPHGDGHYAFSEEKGITYIANGYLLEPETEAERKERKEFEAAYDLLCIGNRALNVTAPCTFDEFKLDKPQCDFWLAISRETNYKVNGE